MCGPVPQAQSEIAPASEILERADLTPAFRAIGGLAQTIARTSLGDVAFADTLGRGHEQPLVDRIMATGAPIWIEDALDDARFADLPPTPGVAPLRFQAGAPVRGADGTIIGAVWVADSAGRRFDEAVQEGLALLADVASDVCRRRALETELVSAVRTAEAASAAKSEFLANMSHEIRTPLNGVMGVAGALGQTELGPRQAEMVELISTSAKTLEALLTDILDLARIEAGRLEIRPDPFELTGLVENCVALFQASAAAKALGLSVRIEARASGWYLGDAPRIRQILSNLIGNAVKFTDKGTVRLAVSKQPSGLVFSVRDTGPGFDEALRDRLFGRFQQADGTIARDHGGAGLGLAISRSLAEAMGGALDARSPPGEGATFELRLPLDPAEAPSRPPVRPDAGRLDLPTTRVLLAEDHPTNRRVVELILGAAGVEVVSVENGALAVEEAARGRFDLILMDMQMPVMDGLAALAEIRRREAGSRRRTPIYALTANAMPAHVEASARAGADGHVSKPVTPQKLLDLVEQVRTSDERPRRPDAANAV